MRKSHFAWTVVLGPLAVISFFLLPAYAHAQQPGSPESGLGFMNPLQMDGAFSHTTLNPQLAFCRQHTYVFFVNGCDPANLSNFSGLCEFVKSQGYPNTYFGQMMQHRYFLQKIRTIRANDPQAHFALVGFSAGAYTVRKMANMLRSEGVCIDLMVYLAGDMLTNNAFSQPDNVQRILNIMGHGFALTGGNLIWCGTDLDRACNIRLAVRHFQLPSQHQTVQSIMSELEMVGAGGHLVTPEAK